MGKNHNGEIGCHADTLANDWHIVSPFQGVQCMVVEKTLLGCGVTHGGGIQSGHSALELCGYSVFHSFILEHHHAQCNEGENIIAGGCLKKRHRYVSRETIAAV